MFATLNGDLYAITNPKHKLAKAVSVPSFVFIEATGEYALTSVSSKGVELVPVASPSYEMLRHYLQHTKAPTIENKLNRDLCENMLSNAGWGAAPSAEQAISDHLSKG